MTEQQHNPPIVSPTNSNYPLIPYRNDTIDLVDILIKILKRKHVILWTILLTTLAGLVFVLLRPPTYSYVTAIEIGSQMTANATPVFFENVQTVKSKLNNAYIPQVLQAYAKTHPDDKIALNYKVNVNVPKKSQLIVLSAKGKQDQSVALLEIEQAIIDVLAKDHGRILSVIRSSITKRRAEAQAELDYLKNDTVFDVTKKKLQANLITTQTQYKRIQEPDFVKVKRKIIENQLKAVENKLGLLIDQSRKLEQDSSSLKKAKTRLLGKVKESKNQIQQSLYRRDQAIADVNNPTQAMTLLMIDSEIQQARQFLTELEQRLYISLDGQISGLQVSIKNNRREQEATISMIDKVKLDIQNFDMDLTLDSAPTQAKIDDITAQLAGIEVDRQRQIEKQIQKIQHFNIQIDNLKPTQSVAPPMQSLRKQGLGRAKTLVLFMFFGVFLGLVLVLVFEMGDKAKQRIREIEAE
jgi:hypothetical protein